MVWSECEQLLHRFLRRAHPAIKSHVEDSSGNSIGDDSERQFMQLLRELSSSSSRWLPVVKFAVSMATRLRPDGCTRATGTARRNEANAHIGRVHVSMDELAPRATRLPSKSGEPVSRPLSHASATIARRDTASRRWSEGNGSIAKERSECSHKPDFGESRH